MEVENGKLEGDRSVSRDLRLAGMITGNATVQGGATLVLTGTVCKDLRVEPGGVAVVDGTVSGDLINAGGEMTVAGTVYGAVRRLAGTTSIDAGAVIKGGLV